MSTFTWDEQLKPRAVSAELRGFIRSGGRSLSGIEQRVFSDAGRWEISFDVPIRRSAQVRAWRGAVSRLRAGDSVILKVPTVSNGIVGSGNAVLTINAAVRATQISISAPEIALAVGQDISIGHRLHRITDIIANPIDSIWEIIRSDAVWSDTATWAADAGPTNVKIGVLPPIRELVLAGTVVRFRDLTCRCVLAEMGSGDLTLDLLRFGTPSITFVEDF